MSNTASTRPFDRTHLNTTTTTSYQQQQNTQSQPQSRFQQTQLQSPKPSSVSPDRPIKINFSASSPVTQPESAYTRFLSPSPPRRNPGDFLSLQKTPQTLDSAALDSDATSLFFRASPKVSPYSLTPYYGRYAIPPPRPNSLPPPKYAMPTIDERDTQSRSLKDERVEIQHPGPSSGPDRHGHGVEMVLKASQTADQNERSRQEYFLPRQHLQVAPNSSLKPAEEDDNKTSPPRDQRNAKVTVVSPPDNETPRRPMGQQPAYDPSGESPYSTFPPSYHGPAGYHPPQSYFPSQSPAAKNPSYTPVGPPGEDPGDQYHHPPPPYYPPPYGYGYDRYYQEDGYRETAQSPGKRQRMNDGSDEPKSGLSMGEREEGIDRFEIPPHSRYPPTRPTYYDRPPSHNYPRYNSTVSESFDSGDRSGESGSKRSPARRNAPPHPPVAKASSYPPPPSPPAGRYGPGTQGDASAASYPGARRNRTQHPERGGSGYSYDNAAIYGRAPPPQYGAPSEPRYYGAPGRFEEVHAAAPPPEGYYREPRGYPPPGFFEGGGGYYTRPTTTSPQEDVHPLLRDDRRMHPGASVEEERMTASPSRKKVSKSDESVTSGGGSSSTNKPKPSTAAQAAIAAGMTEPASAKEVDFDINDPPAEPFIPPSTKPICNQSSEINIHDVLCGRGGGTNTQIGNRRFRSLVQEFQPTYLLCRRKEKPLIARTIVLIIRTRGGRFLKKNDDDGAFYEVGDEKAEAKTSQALREGLDVRASRSTMDGKKKSPRKRPGKKSTASKSPSRSKTKAEDLGPDGESGSPQRDGPPPHHDVYSPYPPHAYYYGYGGAGPMDPYYPPYGIPNYPVSGAGAGSYSPSRKRARGPPTAGEGAYEYPHHPPQSPYKNYLHPYPPEYPPPAGVHEPGHEEENPMWEMDFSPPRTMQKKQDIDPSQAPGEE